MQAEWLLIQNALSSYAQTAQQALCTLFQSLDPALDPHIAILALPFDPQTEVILIRSQRVNYATDWFGCLGHLLRALPDSNLWQLDPDSQQTLGQTKQTIWGFLHNPPKR